MKSMIGTLMTLALQPGRYSGGDRLADYLVQPDYRDLPAAHQIALSGLLSAILAAAVCALLAFLFKLWRERLARAQGVRLIALGPRRSLNALVVWLFVFIVGYAAAMYLFNANAAHVIGAANLMTLIFLGSVIYTGLFLLFHLPAHPTHLPWRAVK